MNTKEHLIAARAKIAQGWCQKALGRDKYGHAVTSLDPRAESWCVIGALVAAAGRNVDPVPAAARLELGLTGRAVSRWNDTKGRTQEQVLKLFDDTIAKEEQQPN